MKAQIKRREKIQMMLILKLHTGKSQGKTILNQSSATIIVKILLMWQVTRSYQRRDFPGMSWISRLKRKIEELQQGE